MKSLIKRLELDYLLCSIDHYTVLKKEVTFCGMKGHHWLIFEKAKNPIACIFNTASRNYSIKFIEGDKEVHVSINARLVAYMPISDNDIKELDSLVAEEI